VEVDLGENQAFKHPEKVEVGQNSTRGVGQKVEQKQMTAA
jgi:hypothetical protein